MCEVSSATHENSSTFFFCSCGSLAPGLAASVAGLVTLPLLAARNGGHRRSVAHQPTPLASLPRGQQRRVRKWSGSVVQVSLSLFRFLAPPFAPVPSPFAGAAYACGERMRTVRQRDASILCSRPCARTSRSLQGDARTCGHWPTLALLLLRTAWCSS